MKNRLVVLVIAGVLAVASLMGCGNTSTDMENQGSGTIAADKEEETEFIEDTESLSENMAVSTEEAPTEEEQPAEAVNADDEWLVGLYGALLEDDFQTVMDILGDAENVREKYAAFEYTEWSRRDGVTAYKMTMEDGQVMGIIVYGDTIHAFVSYKPQEGFYEVGYGDHCVSMFYDGTYSYIKDGCHVISDWGSNYDLEGENDYYAIWPE